MRRSYISPEYLQDESKGTLSMKDESTYFSSKIIELSDYIEIDNIDMIWYENSKKEQLDLSIESTNDPNLYSPSNDKEINITLEIDKENSNTEDVLWKFDINYKKILKNYLYASLKKYRTFEGVRKDSVIGNDIEQSIRNYINDNIIGKYELDKIDFYLSNRSINNKNQLKYKNNWDINLSESSLRNDYEKYDKVDSEIMTIEFLHLNSNMYVFDYYYNLKFKRI